MKPRATTILLAVVLALSPGRAWAQAGWFVIPSFRLTEEFDDNVFRATSGERGDLISRFSPELKAGYQSDPLTLLGSYSVDAEVFVNNTELNDEMARQRAGLEFRYLPTRLATLGLTADYTETETPKELEEDTGIELGRRRATRFRVLPSASYQFDPLTSGSASYLFRENTISGGRTTTTQRVPVTLTRQFTPLDFGLLGYRLSLFESVFEKKRERQREEATSHTPTIGWTHQFTKNTSITVQGGPRFTDGAVDPEVSTRVDHEFSWARASLDYSRTEGLVIGQSGPSKTEKVSGSIRFEPLRALEVELRPSFRNTAREQAPGARKPPPDTNVYEFRTALAYQLTRWLSARAEYQFRFQESGPEEILQNIFSIGLGVTYPIRVY